MNAGIQDAVLAEPRAVAEPMPPRGWQDRLLAWRDNLVRRPAFRRWAAAFPLTRPIARRRARALFDLCAGFVYSQTLFACLELDLLMMVTDEPLTAAAIGTRTNLDAEAVDRVLRAAVALRLLEHRSGGRYGLGPLGLPLVDDPGLRSLIEHHTLLYDDLRDPVSVLRHTRRRSTAISQYFAYASVDEPRALRLERAAPYSALMSLTVGPVITELLDAYSLESHRVLMDVGGGEGVFLREVAERYSSIRLMLYELPAVTTLAASRLASVGLAHRVGLYSGNFHHDPLPTGADVITLMRVLLDHDDASALDLLRRVRDALPRRGIALIAEPMAGHRGAEVVSDVYFGLYLAAMGHGRTRRPDELHHLLRQAGFASSRSLNTRYPILTGVIAATA